MFVSVFFLLFLLVVTILFFVLPKKCRAAVLLAASYVFCGFIEIRALLVLVLISSAAWALGLLIEQARLKKNDQKAKAYTVIAVSVCILILCIYKYVPYFWNMVPGVVFQNNADLLNDLVIPVGLSFYLFQAISYLVDIARQKIPAEKNFIYCSLYFAFFAKLVSGPIERADGLLPQLKKLSSVKFCDRGRLSTALTYMLWGYCMKMVVADRLAVTVGQLFANPLEFDSGWLLIGVFFYTIQIYCDFAGYSYIAIGVARIFGLQLIHNFEAPYCAKSITDFWRRWHISLSNWLREYIYIPLGGNRKGLMRKCLNSLIVFLICGMWHGVGLNFVVWGLLHGCYIVYETVAKARKWKFYGSRILTFLAVAFAWIFFRASDLENALDYIKCMFTSGFQLNSFLHSAQNLDFNLIELLVVMVGIILIEVMDEICNRKQIHLPVLIQEKQNAVRYLIFYLLLIGIFVFGMYGPGYHSEQFIYMQF